MGNIGNPKQENVGKEQGVATKFVNRITYWPCLFGSSCSKAHYKCTVSFQTRRDPTRRKQVLQVLYKFQSDEYNISNNKCTIVFWYSLIIGYSPTCFGHLCHRLQGYIKNNTVFFISIQP